MKASAAQKREDKRASDARRKRLFAYIIPKSISLRDLNVYLQLPLHQLEAMFYKHQEITPPIFEMIYNAAQKIAAKRGQS